MKRPETQVLRPEAWSGVEMRDKLDQAKITGQVLLRRSDGFSRWPTGYHTPCSRREYC